MDERKNVKLVDEHDIDRVATIICGIDVDGTDYVIYSVKRDEENDNLFISKLINNNDGTFNMVNIEDSMEKSKMGAIVRELITYSVNSSEDKTTGTVKLADGKEVKIVNVLFNKTQNINVDKAYINTVKRAVAKVGGTFFSVSAPAAAPEPVVESVFDVPSTQEAPVADASKEPEPPAMAEPILPEIPANTPPVVLDEPKEEEILPVEGLVNEPVAKPSVPEEPKVDQSEEELQAKTTFVGAPEAAPAVDTKPEEIIPPVGIVPPVTEPVQEPAPAVDTKPEEVIPPVGIVPPVAEPIPEPAPAAQPETVIPPIEVVPPVPTPVDTQAGVASDVLPPVPEDQKMVFDASKETNLKNALGETSSDKTILVDEVDSIREFGQDEPVPAVAAVPPILPENNAIEPEVGPVLVKKAGFANNKFFMVIAITFFLASCVFLGYEVFRYFTLVK